MSVQLNHTIVSCRDQQRSAAFLTGILGLPPATRFGHFLVVEADNGVSLDFSDTSGEIAAQHYAFLVGEQEFDAAFGYGTTLLGMWVRDRQMISMEQAIHKLTFHVASVYGIEGRGLLRPGFHADVTIFDPKTIKACEPEWADDYPAATKRLIQRAEGVHYTIVNGKVIYDDGKLSGEMAGKVLRSAAHQAQQ
jgi:catechol 2,3-dioxygenase-like lactoylglutathione lyase family enzyme